MSWFGGKKGTEDERNQYQLLQVLFEVNYEKVYKTAYSITFDSEMAKDVSQEAFLRAFSKIDTLKDKSRFTAWICKIAINVANDMLKKKIKTLEHNVDILDSEGNLKEFLFSRPDLDVETLCMNNEIKRELIHCIKDMDPVTRQVLYMKFFEEFTYDEIAACLDLKIGTLKSKIHRAREKIIKRLDTYL